jgi:hypothetical protein
MPTCFEALLEQGLEKGKLIGRIRTLQEVLGQPVAGEDVLVSLSLEDLQALAAQLQESLAIRPLHPGNG